MSYAGTRRILDADSHRMELPDFLSAHASPDEALMLPSVIELASARGGAEVIGSKDLCGIDHAAERFLSVLALDGVLERSLEGHPETTKRRFYADNLADLILP